jgi:hypothetical protein
MSFIDVPLPTDRPEDQSLYRRAICKIYIADSSGNGRDVTDAMDPYLISIQVIDRLTSVGNGYDEAFIELDDRDARLDVPDDNTSVTIYFGWAATGPKLDKNPPAVPPSSIPQVPGGLSTEAQLSWKGLWSSSPIFRGRVDSIESGFARGGGGRRMWIECRGADMKGPGGTPMYYAEGVGEKDDTGGTFSTTQIPGGWPQGVLPFTAGTSGIPANWITFGSFLVNLLAKDHDPLVIKYIDPAVGNMMRDWLAATGESARSWVHRMSGRGANQGTTGIGYDYDINNNNELTIWSTNATGTVHQAWWGINLISWRIKPYIARSQFQAAAATWLDLINGTFRDTKEIIPGGSNAYYKNARSVTSLPGLAPNRQIGDQSADTQVQSSLVERGTGWAIVNGDPRIRAGDILRIVGARPGVDAGYRITEAEHHYQRAGGYITRCTLSYPEANTKMSGRF